MLQVILVAIAIQHDFAYGSFCVGATGTVFNNTWPRLVRDRTVNYPAKNCLARSCTQDVQESCSNLESCKNTPCIRFLDTRSAR